MGEWGLRARSEVSGAVSKVTRGTDSAPSAATARVVPAPRM